MDVDKLQQDGLLEILQSERRKSESLNDDTDEMTDDANRFAEIQQRDLDKITGGGQVVVESTLDLDNMDRFLQEGEDGNGVDRPTQGKYHILLE